MSLLHEWVSPRTGAEIRKTREESVLRAVLWLRTAPPLTMAPEMHSASPEKLGPPRFAPVPHFRPALHEGHVKLTAATSQAPGLSHAPVN